MSAKNVEKIDKASVAAIIGMVIAFSVTLLLCELLGGMPLAGVADTVGTMTDQKSYFLVYFDGYDNFTLAREDAELLKQMGGGGYVYKDGEGYFVVLAAYKTEKEAQSVCEKNTSAKLRRVDIASLPTVKESDKAAVEKVLNYGTKVIDDLIDIAISLDKKEITDADAILKIKAFIGDINTIKAEFEQNVKMTDNVIYTQIKIALNVAAGMLDNITNEKLAKISLVSEIRYYTTALLKSYQDLLLSAY